MSLREESSNMALEQEHSSPTVEPRFVLDTDWRGYTKILDAVGEGHVRLNYDGGRLEFLSPSPEHELTKSLLGSLVEVLMDERDVRYQKGGSITFRRKALDKGLEPDECFWVANRKSMINVKRWMPSVHPPPDLVIEIEVSQGVVSRLPILAALGVPEVWHWRANELRPLGLRPDGTYEVLTGSRVVAEVDFGVLTEHMRLADRHDTSEIKALYRRHLRRA